MFPSFSSRGSRMLRFRTSCRDAHAVNEVQTVRILPAKQPLHSFFASQDSSLGASSNDDGAPDNLEFSILSWNILLPNSQDNWWNHKMYSQWVPMDKRKWPYRQALIRERLLLSGADIICIQEADGDTFQDDFAFLKEAGYHHCLHKSFAFAAPRFSKVKRLFSSETPTRTAHSSRRCDPVTAS